MLRRAQFRFGLGLSTDREALDMAEDVVCKHLGILSVSALFRKRDPLMLLGTKILHRKTFRSIGIKGSLKREVPGAVVRAGLGLCRR